MIYLISLRVRGSAPLGNAQDRASGHPLWSVIGERLRKSQATAPLSAYYVLLERVARIHGFGAVIQHNEPVAFLGGKPRHDAVLGRRRDADFMRRPFFLYTLQLRLQRFKSLADGFFELVSVLRAVTVWPGICATRTASWVSSAFR